MCHEVPQDHRIQLQPAHRSRVQLPVRHRVQRGRSYLRDEQDGRAEPSRHPHPDMHVRRGLVGRVLHRSGRWRRPVPRACVHGLRRTRQPVRYGRGAERGQGIRQPRQLSKEVGHGHRRLRLAGWTRRSRTRRRRQRLHRRAVRQPRSQADSQWRVDHDVGRVRRRRGTVQPALGSDGGLQTETCT